MQSQFNLGIFYYNGDFIPEDKKKAFNWLKKCAELGDIDSQNYIGKMLLEGKGIQKDLEEGLQWIIKSANNGNILINGDFNKKKDIYNGVRWIQKSASNDFEKAKDLFQRKQMWKYL